MINVQEASLYIESGPFSVSNLKNIYAYAVCNDLFIYYSFFADGYITLVWYKYLIIDSLKYQVISPV